MQSKLKLKWSQKYKITLLHLFARIVSARDFVGVEAGGLGAVAAAISVSTSCSASNSWLIQKRIPDSVQAQGVVGINLNKNILKIKHWLRFLNTTKLNQEFLATLCG
jgi:hypothetical protein